MTNRSSNASSVKGILSLLQRIHASPEKYQSNEAVLNALRTQGALPKLRMEELHISPMALNTLKSVANATVAGGYLTIEELRKSASVLINLAPSEAALSKRTKAGIEQKNALLKEQILQYEEDLFHLSKAFWRAITELRGIALNGKDPMLSQHCAEVEEILRSMASPMSRRMLEIVK